MSENLVHLNIMVGPHHKAALEGAARSVKVSTSSIVRGLIDMYGEKYFRKLERHQIQGEVKIV